MNLHTRLCICRIRCGISIHSKACLPPNLQSCSHNSWLYAALVFTHPRYSAYGIGISCKVFRLPLYYEHYQQDHHSDYGHDCCERKQAEIASFIVIMHSDSILVMSI